MLKTLILLFITGSLNAQQLLNEPDARLHFAPVFTQGLIIHDNIVWESSGLYSKSMLTKWNLKTGKVLQQKKLEDNYFAEGLTMLNGQLYQLTWKQGLGFVINPQTLETTKTFHYSGEGWGLTTDGAQLILSDGTAQLRFIDPENFMVTRTLTVQAEGTEINQLNELEFINGEIWANVYQTDYIVVINPQNGSLVRSYHLPNLLKQKPGVLNGIAYDTVTKKIWVTGKNWPYLFSF